MASQPKHKTPSFSSSLLDAIYHSTDETKKFEVEDFVQQKRKISANVEEEIESLRRAIRVEKWIENYSDGTKPRHAQSNSGSSTDSSLFSSSETESSASKSTPKSLAFVELPARLQVETHREKLKPATNLQLEMIPKREGRFTRTKSKAMKIYGDLKRVKEPISPGRKITNFLNSIFSPRTLKKNQELENWTSMKKSRSMKDTPTCSLASRSCLTKNQSNKSKRSVKFCPVSVKVDQDTQPCGQKNLYDDVASMPVSGSQFIRRNIDSFRVCEGKNAGKQEFREFYENDSDMDDMSCASSDLFELENIGRVGFGSYDEELPIYGTTSLKMNQAIARGLVV